MPPPKTLPPDLLPPTPIGPATKGVIPASGVVAPPAPMAAADTTTTRKATPFDRFRKYDDLPELTREIVFATQRGMEWLSRDGIHQLNGRFIPGLNPSLGKALEDDTFIYQATGALAPGAIRETDRRRKIRRTCRSDHPYVVGRNAQGRCRSDDA